MPFINVSKNNSKLVLDKFRKVCIIINKMKYSAVHRSKPSMTILWLQEQNLLVGDMLDYGCGKGLDADYFGMDKYDPFDPSWSNITLDTDKRYDTIVCNFVMNILEPGEEFFVLENIQRLLKPDGIAYIVVLRTVRKMISYKSNVQHYIVMSLESIRHMKRWYEIYKLTKKDDLSKLEYKEIPLSSFKINKRESL